MAFASEMITDLLDKKGRIGASITVRKEIKANAPKDSGEYAKSWTVKKVREVLLLMSYWAMDDSWW